MIIKTSTRTLERSDDLPQLQMRIEVGAKAFDVLSDKLYSNKIRAIARELISNSWDSHVKAGTTAIPIHIEVPTQQTPHFRIRDFGTGLSPAILSDVYTVYFRSDKSDDNDSIGCLGLGAKSPFAYTDSFTVTSWFEGVRRIYTVFRSETGIPAVALMDEEPSPEPSGVEVKFAVAYDNFKDFRAAVCSIPRHLPTLPTVINWQGKNSYPHYEDAVAIQPPRYMFRSPSIGLAKTQGGSELRLIMGHISYPIDMVKVNLPTIFDVKYSRGVHLFAPIGLVEVAASREALSYTSETIEAVRQLALQGWTEIQEHAEALIANAANLWEARCRLYSLDDISDLINWDEMRWNGRPISPKLCFTGPPGPILPPGTSVMTVGYQKWHADTGRRENRNLVTFNYGPLEGTYYDLHKSIWASSIKVVFINDVGSGPYAAAERYMDAHPDQRFGLMFDDGVLTDAILDEAGFEHLVVRLSSIPKPEVYRRTNVPVDFFKPGSLGNWLHTYPEVNAGFYVELCRDAFYRTSTHGVKTVRSDITDLKATMGWIHGNYEEVFGVRTADMKKMKKRGDWVLVDDWAHGILSEPPKVLHTAVALLHAARASKLFRAYDSDDSRPGECVYLVDKRFPPDSLFGEYLKLWKKADKARQEQPARGYAWLYKLYESGLPWPTTPDSEEFLRLHEEVLAAYPLLPLIESSVENVDRVREYIRLVDNARREA